MGSGLRAAWPGAAAGSGKGDGSGAVSGDHARGTARPFGGERAAESAGQAAAALDIALTKRGTHLGEPIPMCGVPVHAAESYLLTLIRKGFRVAIAEQMEDPAEAKKRGSKSVVARDVVRLVTPGTLTEESLLEARRHNFLASFASVRDDSALAWVDISTGEFRVMPCPEPRLAPELARHAPRELLVPQGARLTEIAAEAAGAAPA